MQPYFRNMYNMFKKRKWDKAKIPKNYCIACKDSKCKFIDAIKHGEYEAL
jgi:hypothetical protein